MKQILIVEDDSFLNKMLDYNLTADGYGVTSALNRIIIIDIRQVQIIIVKVLDAQLIITRIKLCVLSSFKIKSRKD